MVVPDDQLSLAIGKDGQNARLANRLTGWKIDIKSETEMSEDDTVYAPTEVEPKVVDGRCHALTVGRQALSQRGAAGQSILRHTVSIRRSVASES